MTLVVFGITALVILIWFAINYKRVTDLRKSIEASSDKVSTQLQRRHETIAAFLNSLQEELNGLPELAQDLETAKKKAEAITSAPSLQTAAAENELGTCIGRLLKELQKNSSLSENESYAVLRDTVLDAEDAVILAGDDYNGLVSRYNTSQSMFPINLIAQKLALKPIDKFEIEDVFAKYPLQIKTTYPTAKRSIFFQ